MEKQFISNYTEEIHNKSSEIAKDILAIILEEKDVFVPKYITSQEDKNKLEEKTLDAANKVLQYIATKDIPARYATMSLDKLSDAMIGLKTFIDGSLNMYEDELLSRTYGVKDDRGKYRRDLVTMAGMVMKLDEVRQATGNNRGDFFNETPTPVESPYVPLAE